MGDVLLLNVGATLKHMPSLSMYTVSKDCNDTAMPLDPGVVSFIHDLVFSAPPPISGPGSTVTSL